MRAKSKTVKIQQQAPGADESPDFVNAPTEADLEDRIRRRAYEISQTRNGRGDELNDWCQAETEMRSAEGSDKLASSSKRTRAATS